MNLGHPPPQLGPIPPQVVQPPPQGSIPSQPNPPRQHGPPPPPAGVRCPLQIGPHSNQPLGRSPSTVSPISSRDFLEKFLQTSGPTAMPGLLGPSILPPPLQHQPPSTTPGIDLTALAAMAGVSQTSSKSAPPPTAITLEDLEKSFQSEEGSGDGSTPVRLQASPGPGSSRARIDSGYNSSRKPPPGFSSPQSETPPTQDPLGIQVITLIPVNFVHGPRSCKCAVHYTCLLYTSDAADE